MDKSVDVDDFNKSTQTIGIFNNNQTVLESDYKKNVILDFNVYEKILSFLLG